MFDKDLTPSEEAEISKILDRHRFRRPPATPQLPDWDGFLKSTFAPDDTPVTPSGPSERTKAARRKITKFLEQPTTDYKALQSQADSDEYLRKHMPSKPKLTLDSDLTEQAKDIACERFSADTGIPVADIPALAKSAQWDADAKLKKTYLAKLFKAAIAELQAKERAEQADFEKFVADKAEANAQYDRRQAEQAQKRLQKEQATATLLHRADALLARTTPEARAARKRISDTDAHLFAQECLVADAENNLAKMQEIHDADTAARKHQASLEAVDERIAKWEADTLAKIGMAERKLRAIDQAKVDAERRAFDPLAEMDALLTPSLRPEASARGDGVTSRYAVEFQR